jgi:serine/threonine protein kinase/tetratricopeptide (TPR) repeat protein
MEANTVRFQGESMNEEEIFHQALAQSPQERAAYLEQACAGDPALRASVGALLRANVGATGFLDQPAPAPVATVDEPPFRERPGEVIGPYKLLQQIGEGGMGTVYMAEQTHPVQRKVALKIIRPGMDSRQVIARFEAERQALALMDHPHIAKVLDAGTIDSPLAPVLGGDGSGVRGRPYFVMELVRGVSITKYCDEHHLTPRERLELLVPVCQAVQHAHQKGIIHRDLKPSNVLIALYDGKPVPKVIDFGVAKAMGQKLTDETLFTQFGQVVGTLEYMSPEQAEPNQLDIDTRSDIYSLGVLLYELLTGTTPIQRKRLKQAAILEALRIIREEEPPKPSTRLSTTEELPSIAANRGLEPKKLSGLIRGELDWIVMKCLEKDRNRRYETANGLAHDIERYLHDEAVHACPPSAAYRLRKFARRNRGVLAIASVIMAASMVVLAILAGSIGWIARDRATRQAVTKERVTLLLEEARERHKNRKWQEALAAAKRADALLAAGGGDEEIHQRVREVLGDMQMVANLELARARATQYGFDDEQEDSGYAREFRGYGIDVDVLDPEVATKQIGARSICYELTVFLDSWSHVRQEVTKRGSKPFSKDWKELLEIARRADPNPWRDRFRKALENEDHKALVEIAASAPMSSLNARTVDRLGDALIRIGALKEAAAFLRRGQRLHPDDFWINVNLGTCLTELNPPQVDEAIRFYTCAVALRPEAPVAHYDLNRALQKKGRFDEAIVEIREAIRLDPKEAYFHTGLALALEVQGNHNEALAEFREATELALELGLNQKDFDTLVDTLNGLAWHLATSPAAKGLDPDRAVKLAEKAVQLAPQNAGAWNTLGLARLRAADWQAARTALEKSMVLHQGGDSFDWFFLAMAHWQLAHKEEARKWYDRAVQWMEKNKPKDEELIRFRAEAEGLLGIKKQAGKKERKP